ncbi:hypothetical protein GCK72_011487 [Caenorhabditis remanei]|uniref:Uncharacterized protein n=1 Tax=Caenorhabditis remanei TaxID=31234 RepID=A0A6A5H8Q9_CAERE|nr:hypothetical protein GCK72_011487 [Caenorhabditis remanei]KAF1763221.1 hypothetical protein GCK72_011487 [Caenorhabditis remanei]
MFLESTDLVQRMKNLSVEEAEKKLLDVLVKNEEPSIPFSSAEDVESFREDISKKYRNTGSQSRRFIQEMKRLLEDVIDDNTIDDVIQEFRTTVVNKNAQKFAEMETADEEEKRLYLKDNASNCLDLHLPIFTETIHFNHPFKKDLSRNVSGLFMLNKTGYPKRSQYFMNREDAFQVEASLYRQHLNTDSLLWFVVNLLYEEEGRLYLKDNASNTLQSRPSSVQLDEQLRNRKRWKDHLKECNIRNATNWKMLPLSIATSEL